MKRKLPYSSMTLSELVSAFRQIALDQSAAVDVNDTRRYNLLYDDYIAIEQELKSREGDQRRALAGLFDDRNAQVRMNAAFSALVVLPDEAKRTLRIIKDRSEYPQAADAWGMLDDLERGVFVPDVGRIDV